MLSYSLFFFVHSYHILVQPFLTLNTIARWYQSGVRSWKLKNQHHCSITPHSWKTPKNQKCHFQMMKLATTWIKTRITPQPLLMS